MEKMNKAELKQKVKSFVSTLHTEKGLELLENFITNSKNDYNGLEKTITVNLAALKNAKEQWTNGILNNLDHNEALNKINLTTLSIVDKIKEDDEIVIEPNGIIPNLF